MENKKQAEAARRAKLLKMRAERLPDIKKQFEENQKRNFNANFAPGGKDEKLVRGKRKAASKAAKPVAKKPIKKSNTKATKATKAAPTATDKKREVNLLVSTRKGEMVHHQRMLSQDVNAQATQHIIGIPVNKSRYNGYNGQQVTMAQIKSARQHRDAVRIIPIGGLGEFGIGKNMTAIEYQGEIILIDMGTLFASEDYPGVNYMVPDAKWLEDNRDNVKEPVKRLQKYFCRTADEARVEFAELQELVGVLFSLTRRYIKELDILKRKKNVLTFSDIELLAVRLLAAPDGEGGYVKTAQGHEISSRFDTQKVCALCGLISFFECAILVIAVKILGRQKGKSLTFTAA